MRVILSTAALVVAGAATPAVAGNMYSGGGVFYADSRMHEYFYYNASDFTIEQTRWERENVYDPTDMDSQYASHDASDVTIGDSLTGSSYGYFYCDRIAYADVCRHGHVHIYANYNPDATTRRATLCQEIGHGVGLQHNTGEGCMNGARNSPWLGDHNRAHINARY